MADTNFRARKGLTVGETQVTIDGTTGDIVTVGDIAVNGGDITTTSTTMNIAMANATTINTGNVANFINIGKQSTNDSVVTVYGDVAVNGGDLFTPATTATVFNNSATTLEIGKVDAATVRIGATTGTLTIGNPTVVGTQTTQNLFNTTATTVNAFGAATAVNIGASAGVVNVAGDLKVTGNDIQASDNNATITFTTLTSPLKPNTTFSGNIVKGVIRDATTLANGNSWSFSSGAGAANLNYVGLSIDNTNAPNAGNRTGIALRNSAASPGNALIMETSRGTLASPTAIQNNDLLGFIAMSGYNGTQWLTDAVSQSPGAINFQAAENFSGTSNAGVRFNVIAQATATTFTSTSRSTLIAHDAKAATYRADAWTFATRAAAAGGTNTTQMTMDATGNMVITGDLAVNGGDITTTAGTATLFNTGATTVNIGGAASAVSIGAAGSTTTFAGDIRINGNDIQNSTGNNAIVMATGASPQVTFTGDIKVDGGEINGPTTGILNILSTNHTNISNPNFTHFNKTPTDSAGISLHPSGQADNTESLIYARTHTSDGTKFTRVSYNTFRTVDGINYTPTQNNDVIGTFLFNGNANTGTTPGGAVPGASVYAIANQTWTGSAQGTTLKFDVIKNGANTTFTGLEISSPQTNLRGDQLYFQNSSGTPLTSASINYTRTYGEFAYTNAAGFNIPAQNTIYIMPLDTTLNNSGVTISGTGNININVSGWYKIIISLQITLTVSNQPGQIDFWLRKNGANVANSKTQVDLLKDQKSVIAMDWLVNSNGTDYWEIVYVGTTANYADIDFPTIAATTTPYVSPVAPALIVNVIPAGM